MTKRYTNVNLIIERILEQESLRLKVEKSLRMEELESLRMYDQESLRMEELESLRMEEEESLRMDEEESLRMEEQESLQLYEEESLRMEEQESLQLDPESLVAKQRSLLAQLLDDIDFIYNECEFSEEDEKDLSIDHPNINMKILDLNMIKTIKNQISNKLYVMSPIKIRKVNNSNLQHLIDTTSSIEVIYLLRYEIDNYFAIIVQKSDLLIVMGYTLLLNRLSNGCLLKTVFTKRGGDIYVPNEILYKNLFAIDKVEKLYRLDLSPSFYFLPPELYLNCIKSLLGDGYLWNLISSIFDLPILDVYGNNITKITEIDGEDILNVKQLPFLFRIHPYIFHPVLFNRILKDTFDPEFRKEFPEVEWIRIQSEVFIVCRDNNHINLNEITLLLKKLNLIGFIQTTGVNNNHPIQCEGGCTVFVNSDRKIDIWDP